MTVSFDVELGPLLAAGHPNLTLDQVTLTLGGHFRLQGGYRLPEWMDLAPDHVHSSTIFVRQRSGLSGAVVALIAVGAVAAFFIRQILTSSVH